MLYYLSLLFLFVYYILNDECGRQEAGLVISYVVLNSLQRFHAGELLKSPRRCLDPLSVGLVISNASSIY